jgi:GT2 family glycosyltransferase/glycosyltransferase involved in cell wall biosynthesis
VNQNIDRLMKKGKNNPVKCFFWSFRNEGVAITFRRTFNYVLFGEGFLQKQSEIESVKSEKEKYFLLSDLLGKYKLGNFSYEIPFGEKIDIVIPVYNGFDFLQPLFDSLFSGTNKECYRLIIINDCSTDKRVENLLESLKNSNQDKDIIILNNKENLGFVKSVNKAVKKAQNHFVILNSDTEVPAGWLERIMYPILNLEKIASVTPFTNAGTICSFPETNKDNGLFNGLNPDQIDGVFKSVDPQGDYFELPTGVGFCMAFNLDVVKKIGIFDEETFGKGYGEENDWSLRANRIGYKNVLVPNLFVYHKHGGSFASEEKKKLSEEHLGILQKRYPDYVANVGKFLAGDIAGGLRFFYALLLFLKYPIDCKTIVFFDHDMGGGANHFRGKYIRDRVKSEKIILVTHNSGESIFCSTFLFKEMKLTCQTEDLAELFEMMGDMKNYVFVISELVSFPQPLLFLQKIREIKEAKGFQLEIFIHDYFCVCPNYVLLYKNKEYCGIPKTEVCGECLAEVFPGGRADLCLDMAKWRFGWGEALSVADSIICFSESSKKILIKAYPKLEINKIKIIEHKVDYISSADRKIKNKYLTIGILGEINLFHKGSEIIKEMLMIIEREKIKAKIVIIGPSQDNLKNKNLIVTGRYARKDIVKLTELCGIDVFLMPSIWPETFSYTTEEIIKMNMPVAVFDLGAPAERVARYDNGLIIPNVDAKLALNSIIEFARKF